MPDFSIVQSLPLPETPAATSYAGSRLLQGQSDILGLLDSKADQYGVPRNLVRTVASMESSLNPSASSGKAFGLMQLEPTTAKALGVKNVWDPEQNADGGTRLLRDLVNKYNGDTRLVLAAYNAGEPAVDRAGGVPNYPETQKYVAKGLKSLPANLSAGLAPPAAPAPAAPPATTPAETSSPGPATQPTAAQAASGIDAILARIQRGENVEVTPEDILRVAFGPTGVQTAPAPPSAAEPPAAPAFSVVKSLPLPPQPKPAELTPTQKAGWGFVQGLDTPHLLSPALSVLDLIQGKGLGPTVAAIPGQAQGVAQGIANELPGWTPGGGFTPGRALTEWGRTGESAMRLLRGDFSDPVGTLYHLFGSIPLAGAALQHIADKIGQGDPATAMGLTGAFLVQVLGPDAAAEVAPKIMPAVDRAATAVKTGVGKVVDVATSPVVKDVIGVVSPRTRNILNLATRVGKVAESLRGETPETPAPAAAAPAPPTAEAMTPGQILAKSQGQDWSALSANDQAMLEQIAKGQANVAAQPAPAAPAPQAAPPEAPPAPPTTAQPLKPGDAVQWTSQGVDQFQEPRRIRGFSQDGKWAFVEGTLTGIPVEQLTRAEAPGAPPPAPPLTPQDLTEMTTGRPPSRQSAAAQQTAAETLATAQAAAPPAAAVAPEAPPAAPATPPPAEAPTGLPVDSVAWTREQLAAGNKVSPGMLQRQFGMKYSAARKLLKDLAPPVTSAEGAAAFEQAKASGLPAVTPSPEEAPAPPEPPSDLEQQLAASIREAQARKTAPAPVVQPGQTTAEALAAQAPPGPKSLAELMAENQALKEGGQLEALPPNVPPHYRALQLREGTSNATQAFLKDQRIAKYVLEKGITPEEFERMPLDEQNRLIQESPTASGKGKHRPYQMPPAGPVLRSRGRFADEGIQNIADTMRWMQNAAK